MLAPNTRTLNRIFAAPWGESDWQPLRFVDAQAPPTFLAHGLDDGVVSVAQTEKLRDALDAKGVRVETELYPGHRARRNDRGILEGGTRKRADPRSGGGLPRHAHFAFFDRANRSVAVISSLVMPTSNAEWPAPPTMRRSASGHALCRCQALRIGHTMS